MTTTAQVFGLYLGFENVVLGDASQEDLLFLAEQLALGLFEAFLLVTVHR